MASTGVSLNFTGSIESSYIPIPVISIASNIYRLFILILFRVTLVLQTVVTTELCCRRIIIYQSTYDIGVANLVLGGETGRGRMLPEINVF